MTVEDAQKSRTDLLLELAQLRAEVAELRAGAEPAAEDVRRARASEERYRAFIEQTSEAVWRFELAEPIPVDMRPDEQVRRIFATAYLAECNDAMARMYGFSAAAEIVGTPLAALLDPADPLNVDYLRTFVTSGYRIVEAESHERARDGTWRYFLNNLIGIVEHDCVTRAWGTQRDVTGRREAEEALRRSEARFRSIIESNMLGIGFRDPDGRVAYANDALLAMIGSSRTEFEAGGLDWQALTPPEYYASDEKAFVQTQQLGWCTPYEKVYVRRDGTRVPVLVGGASFGDDPSRGAFFVADLSDRRRAEDALRVSEARFRLAVSAARLLVFGYDRDLRYTWAYNPHPDFSADALIGHTDESVMPAAEARAIMALKRGVLESGIPARGETHVTLSDGDHVYELDVEPIVDDAGEITGVMTAGRDVTEERRAAADAQEAIARKDETLSLLDAVLRGAPVGLAFVDRELRFVRINESLARLDGVAASAHVGRTLREVNPGRAERIEPLLRRVLATGDPITGVETQQPGPDGADEAVDTIVSCYPVLGASGAIEHVGLVVADITERKRAEAALRHAQKLESIGVLAGGIAHDFNNLLTGIMGNATLAARVMSPASTVHAAPLLNDVVRAAQRAADLTSQLLAYAGKGRFFVRKVDLGALAGDISSLVRSSIAKKVELRLTVDPATPPVEADASQLQQLVMNLVLNGAEAIGSGPGAVSIDVREMLIGAVESAARFGAFELAPGRFAALEVVDTGCGMDAATLAQIYDPFFTTKFTGRGLGLAAALGIVRGHRGGISVRSAPGQGTTFTVVFPAATAPVLPAPNLAVPSAGAESTGAELVLVVDDEDIVRRTARLTLEEYGYSVLTAADGAEALEVFRRFGGRIRLVILDMTMPVMGGEETAGHLRGVDPSIPILVTSGYGEAEAMRRFDGTRVDRFLQKPFAAPELASAVRAMMESHSGPDG